MEFLDIVDKYGEPTGEVASRTVVHEKGLRHRTSHVWLIRKKENKTEILLQKRSNIKDCHPNCYDISSAGHIPASQDYIPSAIRELNEELGITAVPDELIFIGYKEDRFELEFYGKMFRNDQISKVFLLKRDIPEDRFILQTEEVSEVKWIELEECINAVRNELIPNCIAVDELCMIRDWCNKNF